MSSMRFLIAGSLITSLFTILYKPATALFGYTYRYFARSLPRIEKPSQHKAYLGSFLHTPVSGEVELMRQALIVIDSDGRIAAVYRDTHPDFESTCARHDGRGTLFRFLPGQLVIPGLVDLHIHAPQWPQLGKALDLPLEEWLLRHTFPLEARYKDTNFALPVYESLVSELLANGTTTALYFGTIHTAATLELARICLKHGQRGLVGRVCMDDTSQCPDYYRDASAEIAARETEDFIRQVLEMPGNASGLVKPVVTPRFIPSCSDALLHMLGEIAQRTGCHVQTHCSESDWEHNYVLKRCGVTDTKALDGFRLLHRRTVLAHANFLSEEDISILQARGSSIAHCPMSNAYFANAVFPLRKQAGLGVRVGLGTDIAGGASPSVMENARLAVLASRALETGVNHEIPHKGRGSPDSRVDAATAFYLATAGGGQALDLPVGVFQPGYFFDAVLLDTSLASGLHCNLRCDVQRDSPLDVLQKVVYHMSRGSIRQVWVANQQVHLRA